MRSGHCKIGKNIFDGVPCKFINVETKKVEYEFNSIKDAEMFFFKKMTNKLFYLLYKSKTRRMKYNGVTYAGRLSNSIIVKPE